MKPGRRSLPVGERRSIHRLKHSWITPWWGREREVLRFTIKRLSSFFRRRSSQGFGMKIRIFWQRPRVARRILPRDYSRRNKSIPSGSSRHSFSAFGIARAGRGVRSITLHRRTCMHARDHAAIRLSSRCPRYPRNYRAVNLRWSRQGYLTNDTLFELVTRSIGENGGAKNSR